MVLTKQYLKYDNGQMFNKVCNKHCDCLSIPKFGDDVMILAANESLNWMNMKTKEVVGHVSGTVGENVCKLALVEEDIVCVGYSSGKIRLFDANPNARSYSYDDIQLKACFNGHKSMITCLASYKFKLVSGSNDTNIGVWDCASQCGLFMLKGHKSPITTVVISKMPNFDEEVIISGSKDSLIKFWSINTQHCFITLPDHSTFITSMALVNDGRHLVTSCMGDDTVKVWQIEKSLEKRIRSEEDAIAEDYDVDVKMIEKFKWPGVRGISQIERMDIHSSEMLAFIGNHHKTIEFLNVSNKFSKVKFNRTFSNAVLECYNKQVSSLSTSIVKNRVNLVITHPDNDVTVIKVDSSLAVKDFSTLSSFGHRSKIRCVAISNDNITIVSVSNDSVKLWNINSLKCIQTISLMEDDLSCCPINMAIVSGDRYAILSTKEGYLILLNFGSGRVSYIDRNAHTSCIWGLYQIPEKPFQFVTSSDDKNVKMWQLTTDSPANEKLIFSCTKTLKLDECALIVVCSAKYLCVSLLDSTVKVFFLDTFKFYLSLYGHKSPVLCMDVCDDLIVTGSSDKNIKIWGLDFGDCKKSIFAHDDSVVALQFLPNTHQVISGGKDGLIKQWDCDNFRYIQTLHGHSAKLTNVNIGFNGKLIVSSDENNCARLWRRTEEMLVLNENEMLAKEAAEEEAEDDHDPMSLKNQDDEAVTTISKQKSTLDNVDSILEALRFKADNSNELMLRSMKMKSWNDFIISRLLAVNEDIEEVILQMPHDYLVKFVDFLGELLDGDKQLNSNQISIVSKCLRFILKYHFPQKVVVNQNFDAMSKNLTKQLTDLTKLISFNLAGLKMLQGLHAQSSHQNQFKRLFLTKS